MASEEERPSIKLTLTEERCGASAVLGFGKCDHRLVDITLNRAAKNWFATNKGYVPADTKGCLNWKTGCAIRTLKPIADIMDALS